MRTKVVFPFHFSYPIAGLVEHLQFIIGVREMVCRFVGADGSINIKHTEIVF